MKVLKGEFKSFGSYRELSFDFSDQGLTLVYGATGAGKSTLPDMAAWGLFGVTAKDGSADDVKSWLTPDEPTTAVLEVELNDSATITVFRQRGRKNDLYWFEYDQPNDKIRGKDLTDTQRLLEQRLGVNKDLYLTSAYFHEFSSAGLFFSAKAKDRRELFEKIANTELADKLGQRCGEDRKANRSHMEGLDARIHGIQGSISQSKRSLRDARTRNRDYDEASKENIKKWEVKSASFEKTKKEKIEALKLKSSRWEEESNKKIETLVLKFDSIKTQEDSHFDVLIENFKKSPPCSECRQPKKLKELDETLRAKEENYKLKDKRDYIASQLEDIALRINPNSAALMNAEDEQNNYAERINEEKKKENPFVAQVAKLEAELLKDEQELEKINKEIKELESHISDLESLYDMSLALRGELLSRAVEEVQCAVNRYLEKYFDSEIRVGFSIDEADGLDVQLHKSGHECNYKQLSKGQRGLLKLCFSLAIMKAAANKAGVHFDSLFLDEALDGLDSELKIKAFYMLEELATEHGSIFVIDHAPEFQNMFSKRFHVTMDADTSELEEENE